MDNPSERNYEVLCPSDIASMLAASPHLQPLQDRFQVKITYSSERFLISREESTLEYHQQCKHYLINLIKSYKRQPFKFQWFYLDKMNWVPFEETVSEQIENAFRSQNGCVVTVAESMFNIDPFLLTKTSLDGRQVTQVGRQKAYRLAPPPNANRGRPGRGRQGEKRTTGNTLGNYWVYYEKSVAKSFPREVSQVLEEAFVSQQPIATFQFSNGEATIDLRDMTMRLADNPCLLYTSDAADE